MRTPAGGASRTCRLVYGKAMDAVFFDIDDTIYDQAQPFAHAVHAVLGPLPGVSAGDLYVASRRHSGEVFAALGRGGHPSMKAYVRRMRDTMAEFGVSITDEQAERMQLIYASRADGSMTLTDEMRRTLDWCQARCPKGMACISNGSPARQLDKLDMLGCGRWFSKERVFVSEGLGIAKPDPRIFRHACDALGVDPGCSLMVGDSWETDVAGALGVGMDVAWLNRRHHEVPEDAASYEKPPAGEGRGPRKPSLWIVETEAELLRLIRRLV